MRHRPQAAILALRRWCFPLVPIGEVVAHPPHGSAQTYVPDLPLCCVGVIFRAFFVKEQLSDFYCGLRKGDAGGQFVKSI